MEKQVFADSNCKLSWAVKNLSPLYNLFNVLLDTWLASLDTILEFFLNLNHQFGSLNHVPILNELNFSFKITNDALTALVASFYLSELVVSGEFKDESG